MSEKTFMAGHPFGLNYERTEETTKWVMSIWENSKNTLEFVEKGIALAAKLTPSNEKFAIFSIGKLMGTSDCLTKPMIPTVLVMSLGENRKEKKKRKEK